MELLMMALGLASKLMDKMPNYDQKIKKKYYEKYIKLQSELNKEYYEQNDALIDQLSLELQAMLKAFHTEISK